MKLHKENPEAFSADGNYLRAIVAQRWKELDDKSKCPNCRAGMNVYRRRVDYFIVSLVTAMGKIVRSNLADGQRFTEANNVHVNADERIPHNARNMTGIASALGLIAPAEESAHWVITRRGFQALRGEGVIDWVITFRDEVIDRSEKTITFRDVLLKKKDNDVDMGDPEEWYEVAEVAEGAL